jgi:hypothetical protein
LVLSIISKGVNYVPNIGSALGTGADITAQVVGYIDHEVIKSKLEMISNCGDIIEQHEVARRVARRLVDRYKEQLLCLSHENKTFNQSCCSSCKSKLPFIKRYDGREPAKRVAAFAVNYIVSAVADQSIKNLRLKKANDADSLVEMLVELACRARGPGISIPTCFYDDPNQYLPRTPKMKTDSSTQQQAIPLTENQVSLLLLSVV